MQIWRCGTQPYGGGSVSWMQRMLTGGNVAAKVRRGMTAEHALVESLREYHLEWRSPGPKVVEPPPPPPGKRTLQEVPEPPASRRRLQTVSMLKGGKRICKPHNDGRGCSKHNCRDAHVCDVRTSEGAACGSTSHTRQNHPIH